MTTIPIDLSRLQTAGQRLDEARAARATELKDRRDAAIASGITIAGMPIQTDDLSQQRITGAALAALVDPQAELAWKTPAGFVTLTAPQILAIAQAVRAHVQACFDREAALLPMITAAPDRETLDTIDIDTGWPGQ